MIGIIHHFLKCSQSTVYISQCHESDNTILCVLSSMVHAELRQVTAIHQIQIRVSDDSGRIRLHVVIVCFTS